VELLLAVREFGTTGFPDEKQAAAAMIKHHFRKKGLFGW
jgi:hypothetical protein